MRWSVVGDTAVGANEYRTLRQERFNLDLAPTSVLNRYVRFDSLSNRVLEWFPAFGERPFEFAPCRLDRPFSADEPCDDPDQWFGWWYAGGGHDFPLANGDSATAKHFAWYSIGRRVILAADIGLYELRDDKVKSFDWYELLYARTPARTYGGPFLPPPVSVQNGPGGHTAALIVSPSPSDGPLVVRLKLAGEAHARVEAFDAVGRRIHQVDVVLHSGQGTVRLDATRWARGVYVVRATAGGVNVSTSVIRR
jgi:hypothetical protein